MKRTHKLLVPALLATLVAACGGGRVELQPAAAADPLSELPASASRSTAAMASYMAALAASPADNREPLAVDAFNPPRPDDTEPEPVGG